MTKIVEMQHSELGPSAAERWLNCPGSVLLTRNMDRPSSIYAAEGNAAHELSEWCRVENKSAEHWRGTSIEVGKFSFEVNQEMIDNVDEFVNYVNALPGLPLYEERVDYQEWVPGGFGTLDDGRLVDNVCYVTDLKYGKGVRVSPDGNPQLLIYGLGLYNDYKHLYDFDKFVLTVHQPRLENVESFEVDLKDLLKWADTKVKPIAASALKKGAPFVAGDHCMFCPARQSCKTRADFVTDAVFDDFEDLEAGTQEVLFFSNDQVATTLPKIPNIKKWCTDLMAHAVSLVSKGEKVTHPETGDYKMVEGRSNRAWRDADEALSALEHLYDNIINAKGELLSPAQVEKVVGKKQLAELDLVMKPPGKPVLVPGTDKRDSLEIKAENEFGDLDDG